MRHKRVGRKLGVVSKHRKAMFRNMATDLFRYDSIKTTDTRAKEIRRVTEKLITLAKKNTLSARRQAAGFVKDKEVLRKLFSEIAEKYKDRPGGYTRIIKLGYRTGDNAPMSMIELVQEEFKPKKKKSKKTTKKATAKKETSAKSSKKESAEELGLIEEGAATAAVADESSDAETKVDEEKIDAKAEAIEDAAEDTKQVEAESTEGDTEVKQEPNKENVEEKVSETPETSEEAKVDSKKDAAEAQVADDDSEDSEEEE